MKADAVLPEPAVGMEEKVLDLVEQHPELLGHLRPGTLDQQRQEVARIHQLFQDPAAPQANWDSEAVGRFLDRLKQAWETVQFLLTKRGLAPIPTYRFVRLTNLPNGEVLNSTVITKTEPIVPGVQLNLNLGVRRLDSGKVLEQVEYLTFNSIGHLIVTAKWKDVQTQQVHFGATDEEWDWIGRHTIGGLSVGPPQGVEKDRETLVQQNRVIMSRRIMFGLSDHPWLDTPELHVQQDHEKHIWELWALSSDRFTIGQSLIHVLSDLFAILLAAVSPGNEREQAIENIILSDVRRRSEAMRQYLSSHKRQPVDSFIRETLEDSYTIAPLLPEENRRDLFNSIGGKFNNRWMENLGFLSILAHAESMTTRIVGEEPEAQWAVELLGDIRQLHETVLRDGETMQEEARALAEWEDPRLGHYFGGDWRAVLGQTVASYRHLCSLIDFRESEAIS